MVPREGPGSSGSSHEYSCFSLMVRRFCILSTSVSQSLCCVWQAGHWCSLTTGRPGCRDGTTGRLGPQPE